ncbi:single-strand selective monofunctional uracil DNA glycosylase [Drosophila pseudoobscura]|uniref:Single-strand selective monofunctional uracil DNA glycosylase n=1 Tax=Drosophila pseudoobscura pseudoobscura TaxID=46245 RepID=A0A6I8UNG9_DROPS|nr:single-strand selective monofunctional uracil DNA glycosylase [Drosophila pseudoobscura]
MLKRKLALRTAELSEAHPKKAPMSEETTSALFAQPPWQQFYNIEVSLNETLETFATPPTISCTYNPVEYASSLHCAYLRRFLDGPKRVMFIGMNPGPTGIAQTGIPFGNVRTVSELMEISGEVGRPPIIHPKRPVVGLQCKTEERSGVRLWELFLRLAGGRLDTFSRQCFVHNFCPLAFFDAAGKNITPTELKGPYKQKIRDVCLDALEKQLQIVRPQVVVAVGDYVYQTLKRSEYCKAVSLLRLAHPSPRSVNNTNWPEKAQEFLEQHGLIQFMRNEV